MGPSEYELEAWKAIRRFEGRPMSKGMRRAADRTTEGLATFADIIRENHPRADALVSRGEEAAAQGAMAVSTGIHKAAGILPDWSVEAMGATKRLLARVSRAGLSPKRVVARYKKRGHDVSKLADVRRLDLEQIDDARGRGASWYYPALAALSGAGAGLVITGGTLVVIPSAGAAAGPSAGAIAGSFAGDAAVVLGLSSRVVGQIALNYGYNPEDPVEKLFILSVINAGTAMSATAKTAAMADVSRLTQALVRSQTWAKLNESIISEVSQQLAKLFSVRLTKKGLGKALPAMGILIGGALNWTTLESIVDVADVAYRRRLLIEKYPDLEGGDSSSWSSAVEADIAKDADEVFSVIDGLADVDGPDLRGEWAAGYPDSGALRQDQ